MEPFLQSSYYIDCDQPQLRMKAEALAKGLEGDCAIAEACYCFVRDEIRHSWDYLCSPVTCKASAVLEYRTGYCYAKSHLLVALLRANGIPAGLCYQRLAVGEAGPPYCLHGLTAVYLVDYGWYRCDPRGNKPGVEARFTPPVECLAFSTRDSNERELPEIWAEPLSVVTAVLDRHWDVAEVHAHLPDVLLFPRDSSSFER